MAEQGADDRMLALQPVGVDEGREPFHQAREGRGRRAAVHPAERRRPDHHPVAAQAAGHVVRVVGALGQQQVHPQDVLELQRCLAAGGAESGADPLLGAARVPDLHLLAAQAPVAFPGVQSGGDLFLRQWVPFDCGRAMDRAHPVQPVESIAPLRRQQEVERRLPVRLYGD